MGYSIATSREWFQIPNQTNKRHICALPELCVKPHRKLSLLAHLVSWYYPCNAKAVSDFNDIGIIMPAGISLSSSTRGAIVAVHITCKMSFDQIALGLHLHRETVRKTFKRIEVRWVQIPTHFLKTNWTWSCRSVQGVLPFRIC